MKHIGNFVIIVIKVEVEQRGRESSGVLYYFDDKKDEIMQKFLVMIHSFYESLSGNKNKSVEV